MSSQFTERILRQALVALAVAALVFGLVAWGLGRSDLANWFWVGGTVPVVLGLLVSMVRDFLAGRLGVDAVAFVSMSGALLGQNLASVVIAVMYAGGNILEDFAVTRAERLSSLIDRAPKIAHRRIDSAVQDVPVERVAVGDNLLVRAGEVIPVDGLF
jgi:cation transport ATPase